MKPRLFALLLVLVLLGLGAAIAVHPLYLDAQQVTPTPSLLFLPLVMRNHPSSQEWTQFAHDAQRTGYNPQSVPTPWRWKWSWNGPDAAGQVPAGKFRLPRNSQPVTGGGRVYIAAGARGVYALSNANGQVLWNRNDIGAINSTPAYDPAQDALFVVSANGRLYRLNAANGQTLGQFDAGATSPLPLPPALAGDSVYFSMGSAVFALNKDTLAQHWAYNAGSPVHTPPAYSPGTQTVIVVSQDLYVHAINAGNGAQRWRVKPTRLQPGDPGGDSDYAQAANGWPVIAEEHGLVFVRYRLDWQTLWRWGLQSTNAQMRAFLQNNPDEQPLFALRLSDGSPAFIPNVGNGGFGDGDYMPMGPLPVVKPFPDGSEVAYVVMRGNPCLQAPCDSRWDSRLGEMVLDDTTVPGYGAGYVRYMTNTFFPTDEQAFLTMAGDHIFPAHWEAGIAHQITDRSNSRGDSASNPILVSNLPHIATSQDADVCGSGFLPGHYCAVGLSNTREWPGGFYIYWQEGAVYDRYWSEYAAWVVSNDTLYFVSTDGAVVALEQGSPNTAQAALLPVRFRSPEVSLPAPARPLAPDETWSYVGQEVTVQGQLADVFNNGKAVYLTFREPHQGAFIVRILRDAWDNFPIAPENLYTVGQTVRVRGKLDWYQGAPVIYVTRPEQIELIAGR